MSPRECGEESEFQVCSTFTAWPSLTDLISVSEEEISVESESEDAVEVDPPRSA